MRRKCRRSFEQLIAIRPDRQGQGGGGKLLRYVEETLKARGRRMLMVETLASFETHAQAQGRSNATIGIAPLN